MLLIRVTGTKLKTARRLIGWSLQEAAGRSGVNWLTIRKYEAAGDYHPPATVGALNRLVEALEGAGIEFRDDDTVYLNRAMPLDSKVIHAGASMIAEISRAAEKHKKRLGIR
jgi:transcriptional regulator with XRE-family HTH domain